MGRRPNERHARREALNGVPLKRVNQRYCIATSDMADFADSGGESTWSFWWVVSAVGSLYALIFI